MIEMCGGINRDSLTATKFFCERSDVKNLINLCTSRVSGSVFSAIELLEE